MKIYFYLILTFITNGLFAQYQGPVTAITSGYGSNGVYSVSVISLTNDHWASNEISIFYPSGITAPVPTVFYSHGYASTDTSYHIETLNHIASKGYAVVFVPYKTLGISNQERYATLFDGFVKASRTYSTIIDTTRVGFFGQSFGGGATPRISFRAFTENNWGANGKFIYCSAPWYSFELGATNLANFPTDCKMLTVLYDNDEINDHRMGMDIFNHIAIDDSIKDCIIVYSDTISGYTYSADHYLPTQYTPNGEFDALDCYVTFRLIDALADYSFTGNQTAKDIALGNGNATQINMEEQLPNLFSTNYPSPIYQESIYVNPCNDIKNERQAFCQSILSAENELIKNQMFKIYPNPTNGQLKIHSEIAYQKLEISVFTILGEKILTVDNQTELDISHLTKGTYFIRIKVDGENRIHSHFTVIKKNK